MLAKTQDSYLYQSGEAIKMICVSLFLTISFLYTVINYEEIFDYLDIDMNLFTQEDISNQSETYNHVFNLLEADIRTSNDILDETQEDEEYSDEHLSEYVSGTQEYVFDDTIHNKFKKITINQEVLNDNQEIIVSLREIKSTVNNINNYNNHTTFNENIYILPIADAFENDRINTQNKNRDALKRNIAQEYDTREKRNLQIRTYDANLSQDIAALKRIFISLNMPVPQKFMTLKADVRQSKILNQLKISPRELGQYYPKLVHKIHELYRLRVFASFLPINDPVINARRSSSFGYRRDPFTKKAKMHAGLDFAARTGVPTLASGVGIVKFSGVKSGYGNAIDIYHGNGIVTRYAHLSRIFVKQGQRVSVGEKIGAVGSTGRSTGPHLHYEVRIHNNPTNPVLFLNKKNNIISMLSKY